MNSKGNPGLNRLGNVLQSRIKQNKSTALLVELGTIQDDGSLLTDTYSIPIPKSDYMVCQSASSLLTTGARVLVAWVQSDAVVIDVVQTAASAGG